MGYKGFYWTSYDLVEAGGKNNSQIKHEADAKVKKFKKILEEVGLSDKIGWYRSEQSKSGRGYYIFWGESKKDVQENMDELISLFKNDKSLVSAENINKVIEILCDLLPFIKDEEKIKNLENYFDIKEFIRSLDAMKNLKIFNRHSEKTIKTKSEKEIEEEIEKIFSMLNEIDQLEIISEYRNFDYKKESEDYNNKKDEIEEIVTDYFLRRMNEVYFEDVIAIKGDDKIRNYQERYLLIKGWYIKWLCIMSNIDEIIEIGDFYNARELFSYHKIDESDMRNYFQTGVWPNKELEEDYRTFPKLDIGLLSRYLEKKLNTKEMREMIDYKALKDVTKENLSDKNIKRREDYISFGGKLVDDIRKYESKNIDKNKLRSIKIEAFRELESLKEKKQDNSKIEININNDGYESEKKDFEDIYNEYHGDKTICNELLEIVFDIKYGGEKTNTLLDVMPYRSIIWKRMQGH